MTLTQMQMFEIEHRRIADGNAAFMEMVNCKENPLTRSDLATLIERRPERWSRFAGFLNTLPE